MNPNLGGHASRKRIGRGRARQRKALSMTYTMWCCLHSAAKEQHCSRSYTEPEVHTSWGANCTTVAHTTTQHGELDNADPYSLLSNWVLEYAAGYGKGYQVATNNGNGPTSNGNHAPYLGPPTNLDSMMIHNLGLDRSDQHQEVTGAQPQQERSRNHRGHWEGERETLTQQLSSLNSSAGFTRTSSDDTNPSSWSWPHRHWTSDDHRVNYPVLSNLLSDDTTASRVKSLQRSQYPLHYNLMCPKRQCLIAHTARGTVSLPGEWWSQ